MADETQQRATPIKRSKQDIFLEEFATHGNISLACRAAQVDRSTVYRWKEKSDSFLLRYNQAFEAAKDAIRAEIYRRGHDGVQEPVWQLGKYCGEVTKYSDTLLIFHAKMLMPEYRDKQLVEHSGSIDITGAKELLMQRLMQVEESIDG
jgi:hypothetical protein